MLNGIFLKRGNWEVFGYLSKSRVSGRVAAQRRGTQEGGDSGVSNWWFLCACMSDGRGRAREEKRLRGTAKALEVRSREEEGKDKINPVGGYL